MSQTHVMTPVGSDPVIGGDAVRFLGLNRTELFLLAAVLLCANALLPTIAAGIANHGVVVSIANTFDVSAVVWAAIYIGLGFVLRMPTAPITFLDKVAIAAAILASVLPLGIATWVALSALGLYLILTGRRGSPAFQTRAGWVLLALTVPMFWSKRLFNLMSEFFLSIDAILVSSITHTERISNLVAIPGGTGYLEIAAPCSSMANVSLAILCWVLFSQTNNVRWSPRNILWCLAACASVMSINIIRISLIGYFPWHYELLHGPIGNTTASWLSIFASITICYFGVRRAAVSQI